MTSISSRLREIADDSPGCAPGIAPMAGCVGCELRALADELDQAVRNAQNPLNGGYTAVVLDILASIGEIA